jgi:hypothetical protein
VKVLLGETSVKITKCQASVKLKTLHEFSLFVEFL